MMKKMRIMILTTDELQKKSGRTLDGYVDSANGIGCIVIKIVSRLIRQSYVGIGIHHMHTLDIITMAKSGQVDMSVGEKCVTLGRLLTMASLG